MRILQNRLHLPTIQRIHIYLKTCIQKTFMRTICHLIYQDSEFMNEIAYYYLRILISLFFISLIHRSLREPYWNFDWSAEF